MRSNILGEDNCPMSIFHENNLVAIFKVSRKAGYHFKGRNGGGNSWKLDRNKKPSKCNVFNIPLLYRRSTIREIEQLGNKEYVILDEKFKK